MRHCPVIEEDLPEAAGRPLMVLASLREEVDGPVIEKELKSRRSLKKKIRSPIYSMVLSTKLLTCLISASMAQMVALQLEPIVLGASK